MWLNQRPDGTGDGVAAVAAAVEVHRHHHQHSLIEAAEVVVFECYTLERYERLRHCANDFLSHDSCHW